MTHPGISWHRGDSTVHGALLRPASWRFLPTCGSASILVVSPYHQRVGTTHHPSLITHYAGGKNGQARRPSPDPVGAADEGAVSRALLCALLRSRVRQGGARAGEGVRGRMGRLHRLPQVAAQATGGEGLCRSEAPVTRRVDRGARRDRCGGEATEKP